MKTSHFRNHLERNRLLELGKSENQAIKGVILLYYNKGLFDSFEIKDQILDPYSTFTDENLLENYGIELEISGGVLYLSDSEYST